MRKIFSAVFMLIFFCKFFFNFGGGNLEISKKSCSLEWNRKTKLHQRQNGRDF